LPTYTHAHHEPTPSAASERGASIALIFALLAERLRFHYEHGKWLNQTQCTALAADWLARSKRNMRCKHVKGSEGSGLTFDILNVICKA